jgi:hypothetical protein
VAASKDDADDGTDDPAVPAHASGLAFSDPAHRAAFDEFDVGLDDAPDDSLGETSPWGTSAVPETTTPASASAVPGLGPLPAMSQHRGPARHEPDPGTLVRLGMSEMLPPPGMIKDL